MFTSEFVRLEVSDVVVVVVVVVAGMGQAGRSQAGQHDAGADAKHSGEADLEVGRKLRIRFGPF